MRTLPTPSATVAINRSSSGPIRPVHIVISNDVVIIVIVNGGQHPHNWHA
jgi:hypothetical protein